jgi:hypothetical protein
MTPEEHQLWIRLESIFTPHARTKRDAFYHNDNKENLPRPQRFVHYTSAEAALKIIKTKRIWMRNTTCMSDYREVQHGFELLNKFFSDESKKKAFIAALDACSPNSAEEAINLFNQWWNDTQLNTYIASVSEHDDGEDLFGRLSMWRAFGGFTTRVAIVFSVPWFSAGALALNVTLNPVAYLNEAEVHAEINNVIRNLRENCDFLRSIERPHLVGSVFNMFVAGVTCVKHKGFHEEREWRVLYAPNREPSPLMERSIETIGGVPQIVYKAPLDRNVSQDLADIEMSRIFDRLIIGPSPYPWVMYQAFVAALDEIEVPEAGKRVFVSDIPIRA